MRSAVVTGAAKGIGEAIAARLSSDGFAVVGVDNDGPSLRSTAARVGFEAVVGDVGDWSTHDRAADAATALGPLEAWVNNAGVNVGGPAHTVTAEEIDCGLRTNQFGQMFGTAIAVRRMLPARRGAIVNISSVQSVAAFPEFFVYQAAKAAVNMLTKGVAVDYAPFGIRCNAVLPGPVHTPMMEAGISDEWPLERILADAAESAPLHRVCSPAEVAEVVSFLVSEGATYISGAVIPVDGAATARCFAYPALPGL